MARQERTEQGAQGADPFELRPVSNRSSEKSPQVHIYGGGAVCETDKRGYASPEGRSPLDLVLDASGGFIPLWARSTTLRWRFQERSLRRFRDPSAAKSAIRRLFGEALLAWGDAVPVRFAERQHLWDFEIVTLAADDCDCNGCVLTSAFFPGGGQQRLSIYPKMFTLPRAEQVETLCHELGHVFGLRHFFAQIQEGRWPSEVFGEHSRFSIMNYGSDSVLTEADRRDLKRLYQGAWSRALTEINGTPVRLVTPFSTAGSIFGT